MSNKSRDFETMQQYAPYPRELLTIITHATFPPEIENAFLSDMERDSADTHGQSAGGLTLVFHVASPDSHDPQRVRRVAHFFPVPAATFKREAWARWLFDRVADVRLHELMEYFEVDGVKMFEPLHGPGENPYVVHQASTDEQRRTNYLGQVKNAD